MSEIEYGCITSPHDIASGGVYAKALHDMQALEARMMPDDAESLAHYREMIECNVRHDIRRQWGVTQYVVIFARHRPSQQIAGAIIFLNALTPEHIQNEYGIDATIANQFTFVDPTMRHHGIFADLLDQRTQQIRNFLMSQGRADARHLIFHEIEDPLCLTLQQHYDIRKRIKAGDINAFDPFDRTNVWHNNGLLTLPGIPYVIPETAEGIPARKQHRLHVHRSGIPADRQVASPLITHHLTVSDAICYRDGEDPSSREDLAGMFAAIRAQPRHDAVNRLRFLHQARQRVAAQLSEIHSPTEWCMPTGLLLQEKHPDLHGALGHMFTLG